MARDPSTGARRELALASRARAFGKERAPLDREAWRAIGSYATVGLEFGLSLLVPMFLGRWLDQRLGTGNWLTFIGFGFGVAAGYRAIYRAAIAANRDAERAEAEERAERQHYHDDPSKPPGADDGTQPPRPR